MLTTDITCPGTHTLSDLEQLADQQEELLGPLVNLGNAGSDSVLTFDMDAPPPLQPLVLSAGTPGATPGLQLVCRGNCLIGGQLTPVSALRALVSTADADTHAGPDDPGATVSVPTNHPVAAIPAVPAVQHGSALEAELRSHLSTALGFAPLVHNSSTAHGLAPALVAAIGSVESAWGTSPLMQPNGPAGTGDRKPRDPAPPLRSGSMPPDGLGFGRGLMQADWDAHDFARTGAWRDAAANIAFACSVLAGDRDRFATELHLAPADAVAAAVAAYNAGHRGAADRIKAAGLAAATAPGTYAGKVLARVAFFRDNGFGFDGAAHTAPGTAAAFGAAMAMAMTAGAPVAATAGGPYVITDTQPFMGTLVPDGQCVAFVKAAAKAPHTAAWRRGARVRGNAAVRPGTAIATFDANGTYGNHTDGSSHAAIFISQDTSGLTVLDQFVFPHAKPVGPRTLTFGHGTPANNGDAFFVIL